MTYVKKVSILPPLSRQVVNVSPVKLPMALQHNIESLKASIYGKHESTTSFDT